MATEVQKNFKKQMKQIQKEMVHKDQGEFYSYIEDGHIQNYYKPKNKKRNIAISIGSILPMLWMGYALYTWIKPLVVQSNPNLPMAQAIALEGVEAFESKHEKIVKYIQRVEGYDKLTQTYLGQKNNDFNVILRNQTIKNSFIETNMQFKNELENMILSISSISIPKEMAEFHAILKEKYEAIHEETVYSIDIANTGNTNNITHLKYLTEKINLLQKQQTQQMTMAFDKVGIKYQQDGGNITYWYNK